MTGFNIALSFETEDKEINDKFGHQVGDLIFADAAKLLQN
ncbi:diguanylate cyclase [Lysinibacillus fusiformis]|nr:diguanylate cyclase [Lysinibacillus fusiformis]